MKTKRPVSSCLISQSAHEPLFVAWAGSGNTGTGDLEFGPDSASKSLYPLSFPSCYAAHGEVGKSNQISTKHSAGASSAQWPHGGNRSLAAMRHQPWALCLHVHRRATEAGQAALGSGPNRGWPWGSWPLTEMIILEVVWCCGCTGRR